MKTWAELYGDPEFSPPRYPEPVVVRWANKDLHPGAKVLDVGCGAGRHMKMLYEIGQQYVEGCDQALLPCPAFESEQVRLGFIPKQCEADALPYDDASFDAVLCWGVLYYLPIERYRAAVSEIHRVLRPGGKALVMVKSVDDMRAHSHIPPAEWDMLLVFTHGEALRETCIAAGFREARIETATQTVENGKWMEGDLHAYLTK